MMNSGSVCATVLALTSAFGCNRTEPDGAGEVEGEVQDLQEARNRTGSEVQHLANDLAEAKQRVVNLEKKLALARQGITDEVLEERRELGTALEKERKEVRGEVSKAQRNAQQYNRATGKAEQALEQTTPPKDVKGEVKSRAEVTPGTPQQVERTTHEQEIEVEEVRGVETEREVEGRGTPDAREQELQREQQQQQVPPTAPSQ